MTANYICRKGNGERRVPLTARVISVYCYGIVIGLGNTRRTWSRLRYFRNGVWYAAIRDTALQSLTKSKTSGLKAGRDSISRFNMPRQQAKENLTPGGRVMGNMERSQRIYLTELRWTQQTGFPRFLWTLELGKARRCAVGQSVSVSSLDTPERSYAPNEMTGSLCAKDALRRSIHG